LQSGPPSADAGHEVPVPLMEGWNGVALHAHRPPVMEAPIRRNEEA
jgi:hypothetical protein